MNLLRQLASRWLVIPWGIDIYMFLRVMVHWNLLGYLAEIALFTLLTVYMMRRKKPS